LVRTGSAVQFRSSAPELIWQRAFEAGHAKTTGGRPAEVLER
jgi:hypothetical protein